MVSVHEMGHESDNIVLIPSVFVVEMGQELDLSLGLYQKRLFRLDNLDGDILARFCVFRPDDLTERTFPNPFFDLIVPIEDLAACDKVVVVLIIPSMIVNPISCGRYATSSTSCSCCLLSGSATPTGTTTLGLAFGTRRPSSFSLFVVNSIDVFVRVNE